MLTTCLSVIIPTYNRGNLIKKTLDSLIMQDYSKEQYEIVVVDNNSTDDTRTIISDYCEVYPHIKYVFEPIPGLISGRHRGAMESSGSILIFCDDDIQLQPDALKVTNETFMSNPNIGLVGGKYIPNYQTPPPKWLDFFWQSTPYGGKACASLSLLDLGDKLLTIDTQYVWGLFYQLI
jgi:glycosyltransferase involved in cell wall biosynthesis